MRLIQRTGPQTLELNFMWLPTWIGLNGQLLEELERKLKDQIIGRPLTDTSLDEVEAMVRQWLSDKFPEVPGLWDYLDGLKFVRYEDPSEPADTSSMTV